MKKIFEYLTIGLILTNLYPMSTFAQTVTDDPLYQLVFNEEFDSLGLDTSRWYTNWPWGPNIPNSNVASDCGGIDMEFPRDDWSGGQNRVFDTVGTGFHRIINRRENFNAPIFVYEPTLHDSLVPFRFSSALLYGKNIFKYGYFEMKFRTSNYSAHLNSSYGPNWWMWSGGDTTNAEYSEIDFFEMNGQEWKKGFNIHYRHLRPTPTYSGPQFDTTFFHAMSVSSAGDPRPYDPNFFGPDAPGSWHKVACEWTPNYTDIYYDSNVTTRRYTDAKMYVSQLNAMPMIIDVYTPARQYCVPFDTILTLMPFQYDVDYVKVWQIRQNCIPQSFLNTGSSTYISTLWQSLSIGGIGGAAIFSAENHHLAAQDFVLLQEGFEASGSNTTVTFSTRNCITNQVNAKKYNASPLKNISSALKKDIMYAKSNEN